MVGRKAHNQTNTLNFFVFIPATFCRWTAWLNIDGGGIADKVSINIFCGQKLLKINKKAVCLGVKGDDSQSKVKGSIPTFLLHYAKWIYV